MLSYQKLDAYRVSIEFLAFSRSVRQSLSKGNSDLADQLRRSAQSVPQNIAEAVGKTSRADRAKYYAIARGSAMESGAHLEIMRIEELVDEQTFVSGMELLERIVAMLTKLLQA